MKGAAEIISMYRIILINKQQNIIVKNPLSSADKVQKLKK